jgi:hypothetical protein
MSNVVKFSINGDTNAEQVAGRAKGAMSGLEKQLDGIGKKFGTGFKDIFLSFLGPMALLGTAMAFIGKMIAENQKKQEDATQSAIDGTNALMSAEDKYWANKRNNEKKVVKDTEEAEIQRKTTTEEFLQEDPRGKKIFDMAFIAKLFGHPFRKYKPGLISDDPEIQEKVQAIIAEDMKKNPAAGENPAEREKAAKQSTLKTETFKGPEGFSNVIGVGANPVLQYMTRQTDIQQEILEILKQNRANEGESIPAPWTERLKLNQIGIT